MSENLSDFPEVITTTTTEKQCRNPHCNNEKLLKNEYKEINMIFYFCGKCGTIT